MQQILKDIKVLDLTRVLAGPWCTQVLADMGAEVIKIESPRGGDESRNFPPFFNSAEKPQDAGAQRVSGFFASCNRGKKSVELDISTAQGQEAIRELVKSCDVMVENFKAGGLSRYGLDYQTLSALNPRLVYCSITGFGQTGPLSSYPGYDIVFQGLSGAMSTCGLPDSVPGGGPVRTLVPYTDVMTGMYACTGIIAALRHRDQTGEGQYIDLALLDVAMAANAYIAGNYLASGKAQQRVGNSGIASAPSGVYGCQDGYIIIQANAQHWPLLCAALGQESWLTDPRFEKLEVRLRNAHLIDGLLEAITRTWKKKELIALLGTAGVPSAPVNTVAEAFAEPQVLHREIVENVTMPDGSQIPMVRNPLRFSKTPLVMRAPPYLGAHTKEFFPVAVD